MTSGENYKFTPSEEIVKEEGFPEGNHRIPFSVDHHHLFVQKGNLCPEIEVQVVLKHSECSLFLYAILEVFRHHFPKGIYTPFSYHAFESSQVGTGPGSGKVGRGSQQDKPSHLGGEPERKQKGKTAPQRPAHYVVPGGKRQGYVPDHLLQTGVGFRISPVGG